MVRLVRVSCVTAVACAAMVLGSTQALAGGGPVKPTASPTPSPAPAVRGFTPEEYAQAQAIAQARFGN